MPLHKVRQDCASKYWSQSEALSHLHTARRSRRGSNRDDRITQWLPPNRASFLPQLRAAIYEQWQASNDWHFPTANSFFNCPSVHLSDFYVSTIKIEIITTWSVQHKTKTSNTNMLLSNSTTLPATTPYWHWGPVVLGDTTHHCGAIRWRGRKGSPEETQNLWRATARHKEIQLGWWQRCRCLRAVVPIGSLRFSVGSCGRAPVCSPPRLLTTEHCCSRPLGRLKWTVVGGPSKWYCGWSPCDSVPPLFGQSQPPRLRAWCLVCLVCTACPEYIRRRQSHPWHRCADAPTHTMSRFTQVCRFYMYGTTWLHQE